VSIEPKDGPAAPGAEGQNAQGSLGRAAVLGGLGALGSVGASVLRAKAAAIFLGPSGVGLAAEVLQWVTLLNVPVASFSGPALTQALVRSKGETETSATVSASLTWTFVSSVVLGALAVAAAPLVLSRSSGSAPFWLVALAVVGIGAASTCSVLITTLVAFGRLRTVAVSQLVVAVVGAAFVVSFTWLLGVPGQFLGIAVGALLGVPLYLRGVRRFGTGIGFRPCLDRKFFGAAASTGVVSLIAGAGIQGALFTIRWTLGAYGGAEWNGQFQAAWAVGSLYLGVVLNGLGSFVQPRYASALDSNALSVEVNETARFVMRLAPPVILLLLVFRAIGIQLLYSHAFDLAINILGWQLVGDTSKCLAWVYASPLLYRGQRRAYLVTESFAAVTLAVLALVLIPSFGATGAGMAYCICYVLYAPVCAIALSVSCGVSVQWKRLGTTAALTVVLGIYVVVFEQSWVARVIALAASFGWIWRAGLVAGITARIRGVICLKS
jgi:O-antigen/teichoic acid export membrane protein